MASSNPDPALADVNAMNFQSIHTEQASRSYRLSPIDMVYDVNSLL